MSKNEQPKLFDVAPDWAEQWKGMPRFNQQDQMPWQSIKVHFHSEEGRAAFEQLINQPISALTQSVWFPKAEIGRIANKRYKSESTINPQYPVYVISKGRWETRLTSRALEVIGVPYSIVVEPQEYDKYAAVIAPEKILQLPFSNLGQGSIPARNWVWEHAISTGAKRHWILDDNIQGFYRLNENLKVQVETGATFKAVEDFSDRYQNVAMSGFNYFMFAKRKDAIPPYILNTRIYSCILLRNDIPYRWRGRYNEDTDLSLRILKDGHCTVLFNAFLAMKSTTMTMKGGNTDELYKDDGRLKMAQSLQEQHPDIVRITEKWGRPQHHVNYKVFAGNKLIPKVGVKVLEEKDDYGMALHVLGKGEEKQAEPILEKDPATATPWPVYKPPPVVAPVEDKKPKTRFVVLDLEALSANIPRNDAGEVDPTVRSAILASVWKKIALLTALNAAETCYYKATQAYQFGASSYTHAALVACVGAKETLNEMLAELVDGGR